MDNPFADPSVVEAQRAAAQAPAQEDNPFADDVAPSAPARGSAPTGQMTSIPIAEPAVPKPRGIADLPGHEDLIKRQQELEQKEKELERRERNLQTGGTVQPNNWPPLPSWFPIKPCFYHDISLEIPLDFQKSVRHLYYLWMTYVLCLFLNVLGNMTFWIAESKSETGASDAGPKNFGLSVLWLGLYSPCSMCWYIPAYRAFKTDSSFNFFIFFFIFFFQICWLLLMVIGIKGMGYCGWVVSIAALKEDVGSGIISMISSIAFTICLCFALIMLRKVHEIYRSTGATFGKAMTEGQSSIGTTLWSNEQVRSAATSAATQAAQHTAQNAFRGTP